jgi:hypothetical protein
VARDRRLVEDARLLCLHVHVGRALLLRSTDDSDARGLEAQGCSERESDLPFCGRAVMALDVEWSEMRARSWCETVTCRRLRSVVRCGRELSWHTSVQWDGRVFVVEFHVGGHERAGGGHERAVLWCVCDISERGVCTLGVCVQVDERAGPWGPMLRHGFDMCERVNARNVSETRPHTATWTDAHSLALHSTVRRAMPMRNGQTNSAIAAHAHVCGTIYQKQYALAPPQMSQEHA